MPMPEELLFFKYEGLGNDFVLVDERAAAPGTRVPQLATAARIALCDRHRGVGGDGVLTVLPPTTSGAVATMHITNPDGSVPEMCGNGLRCVALYLADVGAIACNVDVIIDTGAGPRTCIVQRAASAVAGAIGADAALTDVDTVRIDMGPARFDVPARFRVALARAPFAGFAFSTTVSMGNPHLVLEVDALPSLADAARIGAQLERDPQFPSRTNVEWAVLRDDGSIDVVVWERGAGLTQACGTGACAVVAAFVRAGLVSTGTTLVRLPGGPLQITLDALDASVWMRGPVRCAFRGALPPTRRTA